jgi:hypothetical protein
MHRLELTMPVVLAAAVPAVAATAAAALTKSFISVPSDRAKTTHTTAACGPKALAERRSSFGHMW